MKEKKLHNLQTEYDQMVRDAEEAMNTDAGESEDAQVTILFVCLFVFDFLTNTIFHSTNRKALLTDICDTCVYNNYFCRHGALLKVRSLI